MINLEQKLGINPRNVNPLGFWTWFFSGIRSIFGWKQPPWTSRNFSADANSFHHINMSQAFGLKCDSTNPLRPGIVHFNRYIQKKSNRWNGKL
jgi:hypothetical protein